MAIYPVRIFGDHVLREPTKPITEFDDKLRAMADNMIASMHAHNGVGLAGNQAGFSLQIFTWFLPDENEEGVVVNPKIEYTSEELQEDSEGCLSVPGLFYPTKRPMEVAITGQDVNGDPIALEGRGLFARIMMHEIDHLNGYLYLDRLEDHHRKDAMRLIRRGKLERNKPMI